MKTNETILTRSGLQPARLAPLALAAALLAGCAAGADYRRPAIDAPAQLRGQAEAQDGASLADRAWWELFEDATLAALIDEALRNGYDVRLAAWRVEEARAGAGIARSEYWPQVQLGAGWSRGRASEALVPGGDASSLFDVNVGFSWEIDLWGRVRRLNEAALARYLATEEARRGVLLSLVAEVATGYFRLRELDLRLDIARRSAEAFRQTHALFGRRLESGTGSALETASAEASLASTTAGVHDLERQIVEQENRLSLLLGRVPGPIERGEPLVEQFLPPQVPAGLPSDLLQRRPDLREAEQELVAANARVGVARADFFPRLQLTGALGGVAPDVSDLLGSGKSWAVGGGLLGPVLQGTRLRNQHQAAVARFEQARVLFERSVLNAFAEVSTALAAYQRLAEVEQQQARAVAADREAVRLAGARYGAGLSDYLDVLQAQQQQLQDETSLARTRFGRLASLVQLYRALGGGWSQEQFVRPVARAARRAPSR